MSSTPAPHPAPQDLAPAPAERLPAGGFGPLRRWVPIRSLAPRQRERILRHLLALPEADRYLRFGRPMGDEQIALHVDRLDFGRDELFGIFNRQLALIAMAHLAHEPSPPASGRSRPAMAEFGVSVLPHARGRGYGARLFEHAVMHARNRGIGTLYIHALSENAAMLHIARAAGATLERDGGESDAWLRLPPDTLASQFEELVEAQAAEVDYQLKSQARHWGGWLATVQEVREQLLHQGVDPAGG